MKKSNTTRIALSAFCCLFLLAIGCDSVSFDKPVGQMLSESQMQMLTGRWESAEHDLVEVQSNDRQQMVVGSMGWDGSEQKFVAKNDLLEARMIHGSIYLFGTNEPYPSFLRLEFQNDDTLRLYPPNPAAFRRAVEQGELSGTVAVNQNHFHVSIDASNPTIPTFLSREDWKQYYVDEPKLTLKRLEKADR